MKHFHFRLFIVLLCFFVIECKKSPEDPNENQENINNHKIYYQYNYGTSPQYTGDATEIKMMYTTPDEIKDETIKFNKYRSEWKSDIYEFSSGDYIEYDVEKMNRFDMGWMGWSCVIFLDDTEWKRANISNGDTHKRIYGIIP